MKDKIKKYIDSLFSDIHETKQLKELKEEVSANLMEKVNDYIANGTSEENAFEKAKDELGDMNELIEGLKKVSINKKESAIMNDLGLDRKHIIGYLAASTILLFGLMTSAIVYLKDKDIIHTTGLLMPFFIVAVALYVYFGLTQETPSDYGMNSKRAIAYSLATAVILFGVFAAGFMYFSDSEPFTILATLMPFALPSGVIYIYLGLTEKSRRKMDSAWQKQWVDYYSKPETMMVRGNISGALWIFAIAAFFLIGFTVSWKFSWIVFIFAIGFEVLIEAYFSANRKNK
jgi:hypothetical protein